MGNWLNQVYLENCYHSEHRRKTVSIHYTEKDE